MDIAQYLSTSHADNERYRTHIADAVRTLEEWEQIAPHIHIDGSSFPIRLHIRNFLICGNTEGVYFAQKREFTCTLVPNLCYIIKQGKGLMILREIIRCLLQGWVPNREPLLMALALCARYQVRDTQSKKKLPWETHNEKEKIFPAIVCRDIRPAMESAYQASLQKIALYTVHKVCDTPFHLFTFIRYCRTISKLSGLKNDTNGWGRALRATIIKWYYNHKPEQLAVMVTKYRRRLGYSHRELFCLTHIHPKESFPEESNYWQYPEEYDAIFRHIVEGDEKRRKRRRESQQKRDDKARCLDPAEEEEVRKKLGRLDLKQAENKKALKVGTEKDRSGEAKVDSKPKALKYIEAFEELRTLAAADEDKAVNLILQYGFEQEHVPAELLTSKKVWGALLRRMPFDTMLKNLDKMSAVGLFKEESEKVFIYLSSALNNITSFFYCDDGKNYTDFKNDNPSALVIRRLHNVNQLERGIRALEILYAKVNYEFKEGLEIRRNRKWKRIHPIQAALESIFHRSIGLIGRTLKSYLLALDVSGSMDCFLPGTKLACIQAAVAIAMLFMENGDEVTPLGFSGNLERLPWIKQMSRAEYLFAARNVRFGVTDCAKPMKWAINHGKIVDVFIVITGNDISVKSMEPSEAIVLYRREMNMPNAKLILITLTDYSGSLAAPDDPNVLVICGMNPEVPQIMYDFILN